MKMPRYLGPNSPWGPGVAGPLFVIFLILGMLIMAPPVIWIGTKIFGWWFNMWL